jgi:hypothetical protein
MLTGNPSWSKTKAFHSRVCGVTFGFLENGRQSAALYFAIIGAFDAGGSSATATDRAATQHDVNGPLEL